MRLMEESQVLDRNTRKRILEEIRGSENVGRKQEYLKRYEVYKDQTKRHVLAGLKNEGMRPETIAQMSNRAGNISLCRKIINKKARSYSGGVIRTASPESAQDQLSELTRLLCFDQRMKKADRYLELHKNSLIQIVPEIDSDDSTEEAVKYRLKMSVLAPWQYDAVEDFYDRELPLAIIISDFTGRSSGQAVAASMSDAGVHPGNFSVSTTDRTDNTIADSPEDAGMGEQEQFVWWTKRFHFTTDKHGNIISDLSPEDGLNPIEMLPFANNAEEQDGQFWAVGGDDLIDGTILVNKMVTDMNYIAYLQGYGQPVITGQNISNERLKFGPNNAIIFEYDPSKEEPQPTIDFIAANPPLESWMRMVEQYVALLLTTNNLSPSNVSGQLTAQSFPSGIAMLIEQSESTDDVSSKQHGYVEKERCLFEVLKRWQNLFVATDALCDEFQAIGPLPEDLDVTTKFMESKPAVSEAERLDNIKRRKDLGINEMVDLILMDNPDMTRAEAEEKLKRIMQERLEHAEAFAVKSIKQQQSDTSQDPHKEDTVNPEEGD